MTTSGSPDVPNADEDPVRQSTGSQQEAGTGHQAGGALDSSGAGDGISAVREKLKQEFPGRALQIEELMELLGQPQDAIPPLLVFGISGVGKTAVVRAALRLLRAPHAYVSCRTNPTPRLLFETALNQLAGHVRSPADDYGAYRRCDRLADFVGFLPNAVEKATERWRSQKATAGSSFENAEECANVGAHAAASLSHLAAGESMLRASDSSAANDTQEVPGGQQVGGRLLRSRKLPCGTTSAAPAGRTGGMMECTPAQDGRPRGATGGASSGACPDANKRARDLTTLARAARRDATYRSQVQPNVYIVFDNIELLKSRDGAADKPLLPALLRLPELSRQPNVGVILVSNCGWASYGGGGASTGTRDPVGVHFPAYSDDDLRAILLHMHPDRALYPSFLSTHLPPFIRTTRQLADIRASTEPLFEEYREMQSKRAAASEALKWTPNYRLRLKRQLAQPYCSWSAPSNGSRGASNHGKTNGGELEFALPLASKYLLLAAHMASTNPATLDADFLDCTGAPARKRRRASMVSQEKDEREARAALVQGPAAFPLERLLAIYSAILPPSEDDPAAAAAESYGRQVAHYSQGGTMLSLPIGAGRQGHQARGMGSLNGEGEAGPLALPGPRSHSGSPRRGKGSERKGPAYVGQGGAGGSSGSGRVGEFEGVGSLSLVAGSDGTPDGTAGEACGEAEVDWEADEELAGGSSCRGVSSDVLVQLATLVSANLISKVRGGPLEGGAKYRCGVDRSLIDLVAKSVEFPLHRYLLGG
eukprot:jgi/Mesen1/2737/ME000169S01907